MSPLPKWHFFRTWVHCDVRHTSHTLVALMHPPEIIKIRMGASEFVLRIMYSNVSSCTLP